MFIDARRRGHRCRRSRNSPPGDHVIPHGDDVRVGPGSGPSMTRGSALDAQQRGSGAAALARRTFDVIDVIEILTHWYAGRSQNELATSLGVDRKTLRKYTAPAVGGRDGAGRPADGRGRLAAAGDRVVPAAGRSPAAAGVLAEQGRTITNAHTARRRPVLFGGGRSWHAASRPGWTGRSTRSPPCSPRPTPN